MHTKYYYFLNDEMSYMTILKRYKRENIDKNEYDFLEMVIQDYNRGIKEIETFSEKDYKIELENDTPKPLKPRYQKDWEEYIEYKLGVKRERNLRSKLEYESLLFDCRIRIERLAHLKNEDSGNVDFINITAKEKLVILEKLGIIEYLRSKDPFKTSTNLLAEVLSYVTDEKQTTLQPSLNAMISDQTDQKNNPLKSKKAVDKASQRLINIGFIQ